MKHMATAAAAIPDKYKFWQAKHAGMQLNRGIPLSSLNPSEARTVALADPLCAGACTAITGHAACSTVGSARGCVVACTIA